MARPRGVALGILIACFVFGGALRLIGLGSAPLCPDEIHYAADAVLPFETQSLSAIRDWNCLGHLLETRARHGALQPLLTRGLVALAGGHPSAELVRLPSALGGVASMALIFLAARALWGTRQALLAAALLATLPLHARFTRLVYLDGLFTALMLGAVWTSCRAWRSNRVGWSVLAGIFTGLALSSKLSSPLLMLWILISAGAAVMWRRAEFRERALRLGWVGAIAAAAVFLVLTDPVQFAKALARPDASHYSEQGGLGLATNLIAQFPWLASVAFSFAPGLVLAMSLAGVAVVQRFRLSDVVAIAAVLAWMPLLLLHVPPLSGEHGLLPLAAAGCLLGGRAIDAAPPAMRRLGLVLAISLNALLAVPFGLWIWQAPHFSHFNHRWGTAHEWRALMRTARGSDGDRRVFATLGFDESQMRGARILFPGAVLSGYDEDLIQVNPASLTHFDAVLTTESGYAAWLNAFPELMSHWRAEERGEFVTLHRIGARTELRASDLQVTSNEPEAPYFALRLRPPMLFFAAEIEALRGDEPLERVVHRSLIAPGRSYQAFLSEAGALIIPWNGWEDDLRVRIVPAPQRLVYSERLYERLAPEE